VVPAEVRARADLVEAALVDAAICGVAICGVASWTEIAQQITAKASWGSANRVRRIR